MKVTESYIYLNNIKFHAFHGVSEMERNTGNNFIVSLRMAVPLEQCMQNDELIDTVNYADVYKIVRTEMMTPSKLIENVAWRIATAVCDAYPQITAVDVDVMKENPPMGALCDGAGVKIHYVND